MSILMALLRRRLSAAHGQHGTLGPGHHAGGDAAEKEPRQARASMRTDHDEVGLPAARRPDDLIVGYPFEQHPRHPRARFARLGLKRGQPLLAVLSRRGLE